MGLRHQVYDKVQAFRDFQGEARSLALKILLIRRPSKLALPTFFYTQNEKCRAQSNLLWSINLNLGVHLTIAPLKITYEGTVSTLRFRCETLDCKWATQYDDDAIKAWVILSSLGL